MPSSDQVPMHRADAIVASLSSISSSTVSRERPEEVGSSSLAFYTGRESDRENGVIKTNSANWVECKTELLEVLELREKELCVLDHLKAAVESVHFLGSLQRLEEADRALKNAEKEYNENVFTTGCKTRSWHKTALSHIEEAQKVRTFCADQPFNIITQNLEERDSVRFHGMSLKLKDEKSASTLLLCFAKFIDSYFAHNVEEVMTSSAKVNAGSTSDSSSQLVVRMQIYCCIIMHKLNEKRLSCQFVRMPMGIARSPKEVIQSYDCTAFDRPLRHSFSPMEVSNESGLKLLNTSKKRPFTET